MPPYLYLLSHSLDIKLSKYVTEGLALDRTVVLSGPGCGFERIARTFSRDTSLVKLVKGWDFVANECRHVLGMFASETHRNEVSRDGVHCSSDSYCLRITAETGMYRRGQQHTFTSC